LGAPPGRVKNNKSHQVALSAPVLAILEALPRIGDGQGGPAKFVMTTTGVTPASGYAKNKANLDKLLPADMPRWTLHDLRRTMASGMAKLAIALPVIEKVLNHSGGSFRGVAGIYQRHTFADEQRAALQAWGAFVSDLVGDAEKRPNIVKLPSGRR
jgi:integrase